MHPFSSDITTFRAHVNTHKGSPSSFSLKRQSSLKHDFGIWQSDDERGINEDQFSIYPPSDIF
jgi:hypothetical protein